MQFKLTHDRRNITDDDLLHDIQRVPNERSEVKLLQRTYKEFGKYGVTTIIRRFGSRNTSVAKASLELSVERNIPAGVLFRAFYEI